MAYSNSCTRSILDLPVDLQIDVLLRLSAKVLLPLKCVCKLWLTLITEPSFVEKYTKRKRHPILCSSFGSSFLMIDVNEPQEDQARVVNPLCHMPCDEGRKSTNVVNGLACIYQIDWQQHEEPIWLYNLTTRETIPLLCPPLPQRCLGELMFSRRHCHFGYDPGTKQYKLLHLWVCDTYKKSRRDRSVTNRKEGCEVYSLGSDDNGWRDIEYSGKLNWNNLENSFCYDGIIYWISSQIRFGIPGKVITQFHVAQEKFDFIEFPQGQDYLRLMFKAELTQIRGQISLVLLPCPTTTYTTTGTGTATSNISVWCIIGRENNGEPMWQNNKICTWTLPVYPTYWHTRGCEYVKVTCSDFGLVSRVREAVEELEVSIIDCFNLASGKQFKLVVNNAYNTFCIRSRFCSSKMVQNIIPLKNLMASSADNMNPPFIS